MTIFVVKSTSTTDDLGLASRDDIKRWYETNGKSMDDDLGYAATQREDWNKRMAEVSED